MASELTIIEKKDGIGIITLNRPAKLNAMNSLLSQEIHVALTEFEESDDIKVVIMTGAGEKAFCSGGDIHEEASISKEKYVTHEDFKKLGGGANNTWHVANFKKPTICALNGLAYGGGAYLAAAFDIRVGCDRSSFRFLSVKAGILAGTWTLPTIVGFSIAKELIFTGKVIDASESYRIGLLNHLVSAAEVMPVSIDMAKEIAWNYQPAVLAIKDILNRNIGISLNEMYNNERQAVRTITMPNPRDSFAGFLKSHQKK